MVTVVVSFVLLAVVVGTGYYLLLGSVSRYDRLVSTQLANEEKVLMLKTTFKTQVQEWKDVLLRGADPASLDKYWKAFQDEETKTAELAAALAKSVTTPAARDLLRQFSSAHQQLGTGYRKGLDAFKAGGYVPAVGDSAVKGIDRAPTDLLDQTVAALEKDAQATIAAAQRSSKNALLVGLFALLGAVGIAVFMALKLAADMDRTVMPVVQAVATAQEIAGGNLTIEELKVSGNDETGRMAAAFNQMAGNLRSLIRQVGEAAQTVLSSSEELSSMAGESATGALGASDALTQLANSASEQARVAGEVLATTERLQQAISQIAVGAQKTAGEVQQTSQQLTEMVAAVEEVAESAGAVSTNTTKAAAVAKNGAEVVSRAMASMGRIKDAVGKSADHMRRLRTLSAQIGELTQAISGIAEQTNLLALNAAIEAARAGEQGRGFAVVADEVRKLAERSSVSAKEIVDLIGQIQSGTSEAVEAMEVGTAEVEAGVAMAGDAGGALQKILGVVERTAEDVHGISAAAQQLRASAETLAHAFDTVAAVAEENTAAAEEMSAGATQVTTAVEHIANMTRDNAGALQEATATVGGLHSTTENVAGSAHGLAEVAQRLEENVSKFRL